MSTQSSSVCLPRGVTDRLHGTATRIRCIEETVLETSAHWGYQLVFPARLEFEDVVALGGGRELVGKAFRFDDWESGRMMTVPPDLTPQLARVSATRMHSLPYPHRLSYSGVALRHTESQSGQQREILQAGAELIGSPSPVADAEMLLIVIQLAEKLGLKNFTINIGHAGICKGVLAALGLSENSAVMDAISLKDKTGIQQYIESSACPDADTKQLLALTRLFGGSETLAKARSLSWNPTTQSALDNLQRIIETLLASGVNIAKYLTFDLGETRGLDYHTGITFEGFTPEIGEALFSGGRYDTLMQNYGVDMPATGFTCNVGAVAKVLDLQQGLMQKPAPHIVVLGLDAMYLKLSQQLRDRNLSAVSLEADSYQQGLAYAQAHGIPFVIHPTSDGGFDLIKCSDMHKQHFRDDKSLETIVTIVRNG